MPPETLFRSSVARVDPVVPCDPSLARRHWPDELAVRRRRLNFHFPVHLLHEPGQIALAPIDTAISRLHHIMGHAVQILFIRDGADVCSRAARIGPSVVPLKTGFPD